MGDWAFAGLEKLASRSVSLPDTVLTVGEGAFAGAGLDSVRLPSGLQSVGQNAFDGNPVLYGGPADGAACGYARENELDFVADGSRAAGIISLRQLPSGEIEIDSVNTGAKLLLAVYGPGMELLELIPAADGKARPTVAGAKYAKAFCWERTGLVPLCRAGSLRLSA